MTIGDVVEFDRISISRVRHFFIRYISLDEKPFPIFLPILQVVEMLLQMVYIISIFYRHVSSANSHMVEIRPIGISFI